MLGVTQCDRRRVDIFVLRLRSAQRADANALLIPSGKWRGNAIGTIVRRIIIRRRDGQFDEPKRGCRVIGRIGRRHCGALLFGRADDEWVLTGRKFGRRMLSLASRTSRYAVQIGKRLLKSLNFDAIR